MVAADPFVDLLKYVVPFLEVNTLQEWVGLSSPVEFFIIYYIPCGLEFKQSGLILILHEHAIFKILDYRCHPAVGHSCIVDGLGAGLLGKSLVY